MASASATSLLGAQGSVATSSGRVLTLADLLRGAEPAPSRSDGMVQTDRWPLPGAGRLHELDRVEILGVTLPLAEVPSGSAELDVSERKEPGSDYSTMVSHGMKSTPVRIVLLLFRDQSLGYKDGVLVGKDWHAEFAKISGKILAKNLDKRNAVQVYYPTLKARGVVSLIFTKVGDKVHKSAGFWTVELEGKDPRTVRRGGGSHTVKQKRTDFGTRADPAPQAEKGKAAGGTKPAASSAPSAGKRGK